MSDSIPTHTPSYSELVSLVDNLVLAAITFGACDRCIEDAKWETLQQERAKLLKALFNLTED